MRLLSVCLSAPAAFYIVDTIPTETKYYDVAPDNRTLTIHAVRLMSAECRHCALVGGSQELSQADGEELTDTTEDHYRPHYHIRNSTVPSQRHQP